MSSMKKYAISKRREREVFKYFNAGIESFKKRQYLFIKCTISLTILYNLFGKGCNFVRDHVVHKTNSTTVLHI